jgi:DNA-binding Lrp family transcriptional regulator
MSGLAVLRAIEDGLEIVPRPFEAVGIKMGSEERLVLEELRKMLAEGTVRSFGAIVNHMSLGLKVNAMIAWDVKDDEVERAGSAFSKLPEVSHCYERMRVPGKWKYNLFTMVHLSNDEELTELLEEGRRIVPEADFVVLRTLKEFKKTGVRI